MVWDNKCYFWKILSLKTGFPGLLLWNGRFVPCPGSVLLTHWSWKKRQLYIIEAAWALGSEKRRFHFWLSSEGSPRFPSCVRMNTRKEPPSLWGDWIPEHPQATLVDTVKENFQCVGAEPLLSGLLPPFVFALSRNQSRQWLDLDLAKDGEEVCRPACP